MSNGPPGRKGKLSGLGKLKLPKLKAKDVNKMDKKYEEEANKETLEGMDEKNFKKTWTKEFETKMLKRVNKNQIPCGTRHYRVKNLCSAKFPNIGGYCKTRQCLKCRQKMNEILNKEHNTDCDINDKTNKTRARSNAVTSKPSKKRFTGDQPLKF
tara:strand:+ start:84 stop:548 length:465 start_codon:yes stop_codon:yes gene_type:complete